MVIPSIFRRAFGVQAGTLVLVTPDFIKEQIIIKLIKAKDPIEAGWGLLIGGVSLTKALLKERREENKREEKKYEKSIHP